MKRIYLLLFSGLLISSLSACKGGKGVSPNPVPGLIVGKWNLQQQKTVQYVDGVIKTDTTFSATVSAAANLQFNINGTYNSSSHYFAQAGPPFSLNNGATVVAANDTTFGTYSIANTELKLSSNVAGFISASFAYGTTTIAPTLPTFTLVSKTSQINKLTSADLNIHSEVIYTSTLNSVTITYKNEFDYYYTK
jgi:hypothetical protein